MSNLHKMKKLNAGCGQDILPGYVNMDQLKMKGVDVVGSLDKRLPFKDNTFDEIRCISVLEHVKDVSVTMKEFYRILKKGGKLVLNIPHFTSTNIPSDPTHLRGFSYHTMDFYCGKSFYYDFKFKLLSEKLNFGKKFALWNWIIEPLANMFPAVYENTPLRVFPAMNMDIVLQK